VIILSAVGGIPIVLVIVIAIVVVTPFFVPHPRHRQGRRGTVSRGRRIGFLLAPSQPARTLGHVIFGMKIYERLVLAATLLAVTAAPPADAIAAGRPRHRFINIMFPSRRGNRIGTSGAAHAADAYAYAATGISATATADAAAASR